MPRPKAAQAQNNEESVNKSVQVMEVERGFITYCVLGETPLIYNQISEKAKRSLLLPAPRKNRSDKEASLKHDPVTEFRDSCYSYDDDRPTRLCVPNTMFKAAMGVAALYTSGARKIEMSRALWVEGDYADIYGLPYMFMRPVKPINSAMDIRTRAILPNWACKITVKHAKSFINATSVSNLLAAAGIYAGIGDFRQERGKGSYGLFSLVSPDNPKFQALVENEGREAQDLALEAAHTHDKETREIFAWFAAEASRRGKNVASTKVDKDQTIKLVSPPKLRG